MESKAWGINRSYFLKVPVDGLSEEDLPGVLTRFTGDGGRHQIMLLTVHNLLKARHNKEYYHCVSESSLCLPLSRNIAAAARFLKTADLERHNPFDFLINLLSFAEKEHLTVYLLGGRKRDLELAERNLRTSFPKLTIIGRCAGFFRPEYEKDVIMAIKKAQPAFLLIGSGLCERELWFQRHQAELHPVTAIWVNNYFEIFAGRERRPAGRVFDSGFESFSALIKHPWRMARIFNHIFFQILVLFYKIFKW